VLRAPVLLKSYMKRHEAATCHMSLPVRLEAKRWL
jgi:hypothetical protein